MHKEGSCGRLRFVLVIMCVWATPEMLKLYMLPTFSRDNEVLGFEIILLIPNQLQLENKYKLKLLAWHLSLIVMF